jgi:hypothetical protein
MKNYDVLTPDIYNNLINIYDKEKHPNETCQKIKTDWIKHCDRLNKNKLSNEIVLFKSIIQCNKIFDSYYSCYINAFDKQQQKGIEYK